MAVRCLCLPSTSPTPPGSLGGNPCTVARRHAEGAPLNEPQHRHDGVSQPLVDAELTRLAASAPFRHAVRQLRFLRHLVAATLAGQGQSLREMSLGVEIFMRSASRFDPQHDSIVRVEARRLRQKLAAYYADEGQGARLEFVLPVGSYQMEFRHRAGTPGHERARNAVAVFAWAVRGAEAAPLSTTLHAELVGALARLNGLKVVSAPGAPPGDELVQVRKAGRRVGVDSVVQGVLIAPAQGETDARATAAPWGLHLQLRRVDDGALLWSRHAMLDAESPLLTLETLARGIIATLHRDAAERQLQRIALVRRRPALPGLGSGMPSRELLDRLDLARAAMRGNTPEGYRKAVSWCEGITIAAPEHASAFALLADALIATVAITAVPAQPTMQAARAAALRALELDAELSDAHGALGFIHHAFDRDVQAAETSLLEALRLAPSAAPVHARYGFMLMMQRRFGQARAAYREARELDPLSLLYRTHEALIAVYERDWAQARAALDDVLEVAPGHVIARSLLAACELYSGDAGAGLRAYEALAKDYPKLSIGPCGMAQALALLGREAEAEVLLQRLIDEHEAGWVSPYQVAMVQARLQRPGQALHWLALAATQRDFNLICVDVDPGFDGLRADPRWQPFSRAVGRAVSHE